MIITRPIISEKSLRLASQGWYTFAVHHAAAKDRIAKEVEAIYHVNVVGIRTITMHGKVRKTGKKMIQKRRPDWKKAIVRLKDGQRIDAFEVTPQDATPQEPKAREVSKDEKTENQEKSKVKKKTKK